MQTHFFTRLVFEVLLQTSTKTLLHESVWAAFMSRPPKLHGFLMLVADGKHQWNQAAQHQRCHLHFAQSLPSVACRRGMTVSPAPHLRQDVDRGHVKESAGREQHGDSSGVHI